MSNMNDNIARDTAQGVYTPYDYRMGKHPRRPVIPLDDDGPVGRRARLLLGLQGASVAAGAALLAFVVVALLSGVAP